MKMQTLIEFNQFIEIFTKIQLQNE